MFSHSGTSYTVSRIFRTRVTNDSDNTVQSDNITLSFSPGIPDDTVFQIDTRTFTVDADSEGASTGQEQWDLPADPPVWTAGQHVTVSLKFPSNDATLMTLALTDTSDDSAVTLTPQFEARTESYAASVVYNTDQITIVPTTTEPNANFVFLDRNDLEIADANSSQDGFQFNLAVYDNPVKIRVTAHDGIAIRTYTVVITRMDSTEPPLVTIAADSPAVNYSPDDDATFTVTRASTFAGALTVTLHISQNKLFLAAPDLARVVTIPTGLRSATLTITGAELQLVDTDPVETGTLTATVAPGTGYVIGSPASASVNIVPFMTVRMERMSYTVPEDVGTLAIKVIARTGNDAPQPASNFTVSLITQDGTADQGQDYNLFDEDITFRTSDFSLDGNAWTAEKTVMLTITDDLLDEPDQAFTLNLRRTPNLDYRILVVNSDNAAPRTRHQSTITIQDNDLPMPQVNFTSPTYTVTEGDFVDIQVTLSEDPKRTVTILLTATNRGGATSDDYSVQTSLTFTSNETSKFVRFSALADTDDDDGESVIIGFGTIPTGLVAGTVAETLVSVSNAAIRAETELARQHSAIQQHLLGCALFDSSSPLGAGDTYRVNTDDARCVPLRDVYTDTCLVPSQIGVLDRQRITVFRELGLAVALLSMVDNARLLYSNSMSSITSDVHASRAAQGLIRSYAIAALYPSPGLLYVNFSGTQDSYNTENQTFEFSDGQVYGPEMEFLPQRMQDIVDRNYYFPAPECRFDNDIRERVKHPAAAEEDFGSIQTGVPRQGELDNGPDVDLFETTLIQGTTYAITVNPVDPNDVDLTKVNFDHLSTNRVVERVQPRVQVMDTDGNELASGTEREPATFTATTGGTHHVRVTHANETDHKNAGIYTLLLRTTDEFTDPTLSNLTLQDSTNGRSIALVPVFDPDTGSYTASAPNRITSVELTATTNNADAEPAIANDDDSSTSDEAELNLNVGSNTLSVTVTAADRRTTKTYTITVTRTTPPPAPTDCPAESDWCTTMKVGHTSFVSLPSTQFLTQRWGYEGLRNYGELGSTSFSSHGVDYTVKHLYVNQTDDVDANTVDPQELELLIQPALHNGAVLQMGSRTFLIDASTATQSSGQEIWDTQENQVTWTSGQNITLSLKVLPEPPPTEVPVDWGLRPEGLSGGDNFRLMFMSSTTRDAASPDIQVYNTVVQDLAAVGHIDIQPYSAGFTVVGCTDTSNARENTNTNGTGYPIYWLNGNRVANDYGDFYDGSWDDEANDTDESGTDAHDTSQLRNRPYTGCQEDGAKLILSGTTQHTIGSSHVVVGGINATSVGPLTSNIYSPAAETRPFYAISEIFQVAASTDATLTAVTLKGADAGQNVPLSPALDPGTHTYTASVANRIETVRLEVHKNYSGATTVITGDDDPSTPDEAEFDLSVGGADIITFTVTAEDGTPVTYTITVTRGEAPPEPAGCPAINDWCATLKVGYDSDTSSTVTDEYWGYETGQSYGDLTSTTFTYDGTEYTVTDLYRYKNSNHTTNTVFGDFLGIITIPELPDGTVLQAGTRTFTTGTHSFTGTTGTEEWDIQDALLDCTRNQNVTVSLTFPRAPILPWEGQTIHDVTQRQHYGISNAGDSAWFSAELKENGLYQFAYYDTADEQQKVGGRRITLYSPNGNPVVHHGYTLASGGQTPLFQVIPDEDGTHYLQVSSTTNDTGQFWIYYADLSLRSPKGDRSGTTLQQDCRSGLNTACRLIESGSAVQGHLTAPDLDRFRVALRKGGETRVCVNFLDNPLSDVTWTDGNAPAHENLQFWLGSPNDKWPDIITEEAGLNCTQYFTPHVTGLYDVNVSLLMNLGPTECSTCDPPRPSNPYRDDLAAHPDQHDDYEVWFEVRVTT